MTLRNDGVLERFRRSAARFGHGPKSDGASRREKASLHRVNHRAWRGLMLLLALGAGSAWAQRRPKAPREHPPRPPKIRPMRARDHHQHPPGFFKRLRELPPDQQERILANDDRFHQLPPEGQEQIRQNLRRWNALTPEQKQVLRQREEILESLSPDQRARLRDVFPAWRRLPPDRQQAVMQAFRKLRNLRPKQRQKFLSSPQFEQQFSPQEQDILRNINGLLPGSTT